MLIEIILSLLFFIAYTAYEGRTLVICPPSLTRQWEREVKTKVQRGKLRVYVYHGNTRQISEKRLAKFDIVITTYNLIKQEYENFVLPRRNKDSRLFKVNILQYVT